MLKSRVQFFSVALAATVCALAVPPDAQAQEAETTRPHLALLFSQEDIPRIRANTQDPQFTDFWKEQLALDVGDDNNLFREAFIYAITADPQRGESAKRVLLETVAREHWHNFVEHDKPLGFLQAGRITAWVSLGYDWLYDLLSEDERSRVRDAIANKGCEPLYRSLYGFKHPDRTTGWAFADHAPGVFGHIDMTRWPHILAKNNFRAIINGGITLGSIVLEGHDDRAREWQEMALESIALFNGLLKDDGSYDEAVAYLNYAMTYQLHAMEAARRKLDRDYFDTANFQGMIDYVLAMYLPSDMYPHGSLAFGDAGNSLQSSSPFWVARNARDGVAQHLGSNLADHDLMSLVYYDPTVTASPPSDDLLFVELDLDWIVSRSGFDREDFVVGMRSGEPMNHEHGDRNSIQLKALDEILLADHRRLNYWNVGPEWEWRGSRGHNMLLVDGLGVQYHNGEEGTNESKSHATIVRSGQRDGYHFWASDATPGYQLLNDDIRSVTRTVISFPDHPVIVVLDKVIKDSAPSRIANRWHAENGDGQASVSIDTERKAFTIRRPKARLFGRFGGTSGVSAATHSMDSPRKDHPFRYVETMSNELLTESFNVLVAVPLRESSPNPDISITRSDETWSIQIAMNPTDHTTSIAVTAIDRGNLPEFEVDIR